MLVLSSVKPRLLRLEAVDPVIASGDDRRSERSVAHGITFALGESFQAVGGEQLCAIHRSDQRALPRASCRNRRAASINPGADPDAPPCLPRVSQRAPSLLSSSATTLA